jgi:hypothetical protein
MKHNPLPVFTDVCSLDVGSIILEIAHEASHGCTDERCTFQHFARLKMQNGCEGCKPDGVLGEALIAECFTMQEVVYLSAITGSINYPGAREQHANWSAHLSFVDRRAATL